jgi:hypothetical protein
MIAKIAAIDLFKIEAAYDTSTSISNFGNYQFLAIFFYH